MRCNIIREGGGSGSARWELLSSGQINHIHSGGFPDWESPAIEKSKIDNCIAVKHSVHLTKTMFGNNLSSTPSACLDNSGFPFAYGSKGTTVDLGETRAELFLFPQFDGEFAAVGYSSAIDPCRVGIQFRYATIVETIGEYSIWGLLVDGD